MDLFGPTNFRNVEMFSEIVELLIELLDLLFVSRTCFLEDSFLLLEKDLFWEKDIQVK